jgi:hypothetical protein
MAFQAHVVNTNQLNKNVIILVREVDQDAERVTLGPRAERTFFVERTSDLTVEEGASHARVSYPQGVPAEAVEAPSTTEEPAASSTETNDGEPAGTEPEKPSETEPAV